MSFVAHQSPQKNTPPMIYRLHRWFFAVCILLAPLTLSLWFALCPQYGDPACPNMANHLAVLAAYREANPLLMQVFLFLNSRRAMPRIAAERDGISSDHHAAESEPSATPRRSWSERS